MEKEVDILIVEDDMDDAELAILALEKYCSGHRIHLCRDGADALEFLAVDTERKEKDMPHIPSVIFLDLKLPKLDGHEVLRRLRENRTTSRIPVVMLTSSNHEKDVVRSYELGANSYIVKPMDFDEFSRVLDEAGQYWLVHNRPALS